MDYFANSTSRSSGSLRVYSIILLIYAILSWIPDLRGHWVRYIAMLVEPVLDAAPPDHSAARRFGSRRFSSLILVLNYLIVPLVIRAASGACFPY